MSEDSQKSPQYEELLDVRKQLFTDSTPVN